MSVESVCKKECVRKMIHDSESSACMCVRACMFMYVRVRA